MLTGSVQRPRDAPHDPGPGKAYRLAEYDRQGLHRPGLAGQHDPTHDRHRSRHQAPLDQAQRRFLTQRRLRVAQALTTDMNGAFGSVDLLRQGKFSSSHGPGSVEFAEVPLELLGGVRTGSPGKVPERKVLKVAGKDNFRVRPCARSHKATVASPLTSMT